MRPHTDVLAIEGEFTIFTAVAVRCRLLEAIGRSTEVDVDLSRVAEFDSAGVQLMVAARNEANAHGITLRYINHSPAVLDVLTLCDLVSHLGGPAPVHDTRRPS